jgi:hypothetical protein
MFAVLLHDGWGSVVAVALFWSAPFVILLLAIRWAKRTKGVLHNLLLGPFVLLPRMLLLGWAVFLLLTALTFIAASMVPGAAWIPTPGLLTVLSLLLVLSTIAWAIWQAMHSIVKRLKQ